MSGQKQPVELIAIKGKKHLTKAEIEERKKTEIRAPADAIKPPKYLTKTQKKEFESIAAQLVELNIMANLDCDTLARYLQSQAKYLKYDKMVDSLLKEAKTLHEQIAAADALTKFEGLRDKAIKQCRAAAADLGLTISSRCRLVVPRPPEDGPKNKFAGFEK